MDFLIFWEQGGILARNLLLASQSIPSRSCALVALVFLLSFLRNLHLEKSGLKTFKKRGNSDEETNWSSGG
jgi:hypothetical protein